MGSGSRGSAEGTFRAFIASTFSFVECFRRRAFSVPAAAWRSRGAIALVALFVSAGAAAGAQSVQFFSAFQSYTQTEAAYAQGLVTNEHGDLYVSGAHALAYIPVDANGNPISSESTDVSCSPSSGESMGIAIDTTNHIVYRADLEGPNSIPDVEMFAFSAGSSTTCTLSYIDTGSWGAPSSVAVDSSSNLYVLDAGNGTIYELAPGSGYAKTAVCSNSGLVDTTGLSIDGSGNFYVTSSANPVSGFPYPYGMESPGTPATTGVYKVTGSGGGTCSLTPIGSGWSSPTATAVDAAGNLWVADLGANEIDLLLANGGGYNQVPYQEISQIRTLTLNSAGNVYGLAYVDAGADKALVWAGGTPAHYLGTYAVGTPASPVTATVDLMEAENVGAYTVTTQGSPTGDFQLTSTTCQTGQQAALYSCTVQVAFTPQAPGLRTGALVVTDNNGNVLGTNYFYGVGQGPSIAFQPGVFSTPLTSVNNLEYPFSVAMDESSNLYVTDYDNGALYEAAAGGTALTPLDSTLYQPLGVTVDGAGNVWVADVGNGNVVLETPNGQGGYTKSTPFTGLHAPYDVAVDGSGNVYIVEYGTGDVLKETLTNGAYAQSTVVAGLNIPNGVAVDASGNVYVTDSGNGQVLEETPSGSSYTQTVVANNQLDLPEGLAIDPNGDVYISDSGHQRIVVARPSGANSFTQFTLLSTGMTGPVGLALDAAGDLYIADPNAPAVHALTVSTPPSFSFASTVAGGESSDSPQLTTLFNYGNEPLDISSIGIPAGFASDAAATTCALSNEAVAANGGCLLGIDFVPTAAQSYNGSVQLIDNNLDQAGASQQIPVLGVGTPAPTLTGFSVVVSSSAYVGVPSTVWITAFDQNGNVLASFNGTATLSTSDPLAGTGSVTFAGGAGQAIVVFGTPGPQLVTVTSGSASGQTAVSVAVPALVVSGYPSPQYVNVSGTVTISVTDGAGNALPFNGAVTLTASDPQAVINGGSGGTGNSVTINNGTGTGTVAFGTPGTQSITASGTGLTSGSQSSISVLGAPGFVVNNNGDSGAGAQDCPVNPASSGPGSCTLRDALAAVTSIGTGNITFDPAVFATTNSAAQNTIQLAASNGGLVIDAPYTTITGPAPTTVNGVLTPVVTVDGSQANASVFVIDQGVAGAAIANLTVANGAAGAGGGIVNNGSLSISGTVFSGDQATGGTGLHGGSGASGGAILNSGILSVAGSSFINNAASGASHGEGGAIYNNGASAATTVSGCTFSGNSANGAARYAGGGAIANYAGAVKILDSTFFGNSANGISAVNGGAIVNHDGGTLYVANSTISGNWADSYGGGIYVENGTSTVANTIVDGNWLGTPSTVTMYDDYDDQTGAAAFAGGASDGGGNLFGYYNAAPSGMDPTQPAAPAISLAPLGSYGGPTQTMIPLPGSPAICAGTPTPGDSMTLPGADQRGDASTNAGYPGYSAQSPCVDAGAVQTNYALTFSTEPPDVPENTSFTAGVTLTESGAPFQAAVSIPLTLTGPGTLTGGSATTVDGVASYSLQISAAGSGDTLAANLVLNQNATTPTAIAATSTSFSVSLENESTLVVTGMPATTEPYNATFTVSSSGGSGTGAVTFAATGACSVDAASGVVTMTSGTGICSVTATKAADANYNSITSAPATVSAEPAAATVTLGGLSQTYTGSPLSATATTSPSGLTVTLTYNGSSSAPVAAGSYTVVGTINDPNYQGSASGTLVIGAAASGVSLASSANPAVLSNAVIFTATVSSTAGAPAGVVSFIDGTTPIGSATIANGSAQVTISTLTAGSHSITAAYAGDTDYSGSSSSPLSLTILDFTLGNAGGSGGSSGQSQTASPGGSATYTVNLIPSSGTTFPDPMTLTLTGLPTGATATLSTPGWAQQSATSWILPANQPVNDLSLTVQLPAQTAAATPNDAPARRLPLTLLGVLLLPFAGRWRRAGMRVSRWLCVALIAAGFAAFGGTVGCGSSSTHTQTSQLYTITVTVTSGALTHSTELNLTVQ